MKLRDLTGGISQENIIREAKECDKGTETKLLGREYGK